MGLSELFETSVANLNAILDIAERRRDDGVTRHSRQELEARMRQELRTAYAMGQRSVSGRFAPEMARDVIAAAEILAHASSALITSRPGQAHYQAAVEGHAKAMERVTQLSKAMLMAHEETRKPPR